LIFLFLDSTTVMQKWMIYIDSSLFMLPHICMVKGEKVLKEGRTKVTFNINGYKLRVWFIKLCLWIESLVPNVTCIFFMHNLYDSLYVIYKYLIGFYILLLNGNWFLLWVFLSTGVMRSWVLKVSSCFCHCCEMMMVSGLYLILLMEKWNWNAITFSFSVFVCVGIYLLLLHFLCFMKWM